MANINKIRVSGQTYDIQDSNASKTVELTQAQYDALVSAGTVSANTYYIITDAQAGDLTQYWTSAQTQSAITEATSGKASQSDLETVSGDVQTVSGQVANKQDTLVSGTNIKTINNESILGSGNITIQGGGGGATYSAGRGIDITNDTISVSLPISAGTGINSIIEGTGQANGNYSHAEGRQTTALGSHSHAEGWNANAIGQSSHAEGYSTLANGRNSHVEGSNTTTSNDSEHASGKYNVSSSASTDFGDSGNTLFSVGNGTSSSRHNAFEIRQNGDIYLSSGGTDIKLQDYLGGGGGKAVTGGTNISVTTGETADTINCTLPITATTDTTNKAIIIGQSITATNTSNGCVIIGSGAKGSLYDVIIGRKAKNDEGWNDVVAIGNEAKGYSQSIAIGSYTETYKGYQEGGVAIGYYAQAKNMANAVAIGQNVSTTGTTKTNINNQIKIDSSNQVYISNSANTSTYCLQEKIENTEAALGGLKLVKLTQSAYDALSPDYDSNTLYVIVN